MAATCGCARTPAAVHVSLSVTSLWQRCVGALAPPSLSTIGSGGDESGSDVWVRSHSRRCARFSGGVESVVAMSGCARTPVAVHAWIWGVTSLWQRRVGALALPSLCTFIWRCRVCGSDEWVRSHSRRCPRLDLGGDEFVAATCGCARTPVAVHVYLAVSSLWWR